jgi:hypothetical protein
MQRRAKGQRRQPLSLPHRMEMAHAGARGDDDRAQRRLPRPWPMAPVTGKEPSNFAHRA